MPIPSMFPLSSCPCQHGSANEAEFSTFAKRIGIVAKIIKKS